MPIQAPADFDDSLPVVGAQDKAGRDRESALDKQLECL
jgi:hypothetical protein